ncbi:MAG: hypothetical protein U0414_29320 [Polyangiaceae bacterium]
MTTRTAEIRDALRPLLTLLAPAIRAQVDELLELAEIGARAQQLVASWSVGAPAAPAPVPRGRPAKPAAPKRKAAARAEKPKAPAKRTRAKTREASAPAAAPQSPAASAPPKSGPPPKAPTPQSSEAAPSDAPSGAPTLREAILKVLKDAKGPMGIADIAAAAKASGYATTSANFSVVVGNMVPKLKEVKRAGRGVYVLAE